jgi:hypothetical protein
MIFLPFCAFVEVAVAHIRTFELSAIFSEDKCNEMYANHQLDLACAEKWARSSSLRLLSTSTIARQPQRTPKMTANSDGFVPRGVIKYAGRFGPILRAVV